jgi:hypothetical protein
MASLDERAPRRLYSWDVEDEAAEQPAGEFDLPKPAEVPVVWRRPESPSRGTVLPFKRPEN